MPEDKKKKKSKTIRVDLDYPIDWGKDETIDHLILRRPTGADIEGLSGEPTMKELMRVASKCALVAPSVMRSLDAFDVVKVCEVVGDFLGSGQATG